MEIEELKRIPIDRLLSHLGYEPVSKTRGGTQLHYRSPFRDERHPSFSVSVTRNIWNDYALGKGGNVIDLAILLNGNCTFHEAAVWLEKESREFPSGVTEKTTSIAFSPPSFSDTASEMTDVKVSELTNRALLSYLISRRIPPVIGKRYCQEAHYSVHGRRYYGICFKNILGGMEIRNAYFKGCHGAKAPSIVPLEKQYRSESCCVFEGFMDFLSFKVLLLHKHPGLTDCDCIILNSTSLVGKAIPFIDIYDTVLTFTDNDASGRAALEKLTDAMPYKVTPMSDLYASHNDLNDYLICDEQQYWRSK